MHSKRLENRQRWSVFSWADKLEQGEIIYTWWGAKETQFKKGHRPRNTKHEGHERLTNDGYIMISVRQTNPHTGFHRRYVLKHRWVWEQANGIVPKGKCLKFIDSDRQNCDIANLELIDRAMLPLLKYAKYDQAEPVVKPAIMVNSKLKAAIKQATKTPT